MDRMTEEAVKRVGDLIVGIGKHASKVSNVANKVMRCKEEPASEEQTVSYATDGRYKLLHKIIEKDNKNVNKETY